MASIAESGERVATHSRSRLRGGLRLIWSAMSHAWEHRILGLAAEAGFWQLLSLPSLILAVLGVIGYFHSVLGPDSLGDLQQSILDGLKQVIVPSAVDSTVKPALTRILYGGHAEVVSIGFIVSLWTGSSAMATYVNTITIAYGRRHERSAVRSRLLALRLYISFVLISIVVLPLLVLGRSRFVSLFPDSSQHAADIATTIAYWPVVVLLSLSLLATLYHRAVPARLRWRRALPGALAAVLIWVIGSILLRDWLTFAFRSTATYGPLSAPVAVLLFLYLTALAILFGAEINAEVDRAWPRRASEPAEP